MVAMERNGRGGRTLRLSPLLVILAVAALVVSACGGGTSSSGGGTSSANVSEAQRLVTQAEKPISGWQPAGQKFDGTKARGKSMWFISASLSIPFEQYMVQGMTQGASTVGASVVGFDAKSSTSEATRGIEEAIQAKAGVIFVDGFPPKLFAPAIAQAKQAGIPVLTANSQEAGPLLPGYPDGIVGSATHSFATPGKIEADWVVADSKGNANIIYLRSSDVPVITDSEKNAFVNELHRLCSSCKVQVVDVPTSQWSNLTPKTASLIRANPDVNYFVPDFDGEVIFMVPGVTSANAQSKVKIVSFNATPSVMQNLKQHNVVGADTGGPNLLQGWAFSEEGLRVLAGEQALNDLNIPTRLFDRSNIDKVDLNQQESEWYGVGDYQSKFKALWGAS
jgi:ribose transport system substrate-binding protein